MLTDRRSEVRAAVAAGAEAALEAMGAEAARLVKQHMDARGIRRTGALIADVDYSVSDGAVDVGNTLPYGVYVHEGTCRMAGRAYIRDALIGAGPALEKAAAACLKIK